VEGLGHLLKHFALTISVFSNMIGGRI